MSASNLTRSEADERARLLALDSYLVELDVRQAGAQATFRSTSTVRFRCTEPGSDTFIEIAAERIERAELNGRPLDTAAHAGRLAVPGLEEHNTLTVVAQVPYSRTGEGLHLFTDPVDGAVYLYSQFESNSAHRMYACFDQPDLKAVFELRVTAPQDWTCVSNSVVVSDAGGEWRFAPTPPLSTYITALVAGPYAHVHSEHDGIELGLYCRRSLEQFLDADELFEVTRQGFDFYHRVFDYRYPFGKYDQLFVPEFNFGAMENAGCVTFLEDYVFRSKVTEARRERRAETVLHEMAHMWFGDLVTMRWWDDLWLNESFATYMSVLAQASATRWTNAWTTFCNTEKTWAYRQDQLPSTHPIVADVPDVEAVRSNFDGITYAKGASVLKQLVAWVGQDRFLAALQVYFRRHEFANSTLADLLAVLEEQSGRDLSHWSREWLETTGVNTLRPRLELGPDGRIERLEIVQEAAAGGTLRSHRVAVGLYERRPEGLVRRQRVELDISGEATEVAELAGADAADLVLVNDNDLSYAKMRLDERSLATARSHLGELADPLARALCWNAAWDMTRDAELAARDFLEIVLAGLPSEAEIGVVQNLLGQAELAVAGYGAPEHEPVARERLTAAVRDLLDGAAGGSDRQLAFVSALARCGRGEEHTRRLRGLLDGSGVPGGLAVDTDLRWLLLIELAARGGADEEDIAAELARDATAAGEKRAATARSARPSPAAKAAAWSAVMDSDALSNHLQAATMAGFWRHGQQEVTEPYVQRYFTDALRIWGQRPFEIAQQIAESLFPATAVDQRTVELADDFLARGDVPAALRRIVLEGRDGVARALRARACDAARGSAG